MRLVSLVLCVAGCGGATAEAPLTVRLGLSHDATERALREHQFCLDAGPGDVKAMMPRQRFPRCERAAAEKGDAWVIARFDGDRLVELRRFERYGDEAHALQRWNELVGERVKRTPPSDQALQQIRDRGQLEPGTRAVKAFPGDDGAVIGVYLLTPSPPDHASLLEQITYVK